MTSKIFTVAFHLSRTTCTNSIRHHLTRTFPSPPLCTARLGGVARVEPRSETVHAGAGRGAVGSYSKTKSANSWDTNTKIVCAQEFLKAVARYIIDQLFENVRLFTCPINLMCNTQKHLYIFYKVGVGVSRNPTINFLQSFAYSMRGSDRCPLIRMWPRCFRVPAAREDICHDFLNTPPHPVFEPAPRTVQLTAGYHIIRSWRGGGVVVPIRYPVSVFLDGDQLRGHIRGGSRRRGTNSTAPHCAAFSCVLVLPSANALQRVCCHSYKRPRRPGCSCSRSCLHTAPLQCPL